MSRSHELCKVDSTVLFLQMRKSKILWGWQDSLMGKNTCSKPDDLNSIPRTYTVQGRMSPEKLSCDLHSWAVHVSVLCACAHMERHKKMQQEKERRNRRFFQRGQIICISFFLGGGVFQDRVFLRFWSLS